jgi:hypothetical protein
LRSRKYRWKVRGDSRCNVFWRFFGVRAVPHLPCSFVCPGSLLLADVMRDAFSAMGYHREWEELLEILSWSVEWSALHGIAEIRTPLVKVSTRTDYTRSERLIRLRGSSSPSEGASGVRFPFLVKARARTHSARHP